MNFLDSSDFEVLNIDMKVVKLKITIIAMLTSFLGFANAIERETLASLSCEGTWECIDCNPKENYSISNTMTISETSIDGSKIFAVNFSGIPEFFAFNIIEGTLNARLLEFGVNSSPLYQEFEYGNLDTYNGDLFIINGKREPNDVISVKYIYQGKCKKAERLF